MSGRGGQGGADGRDAKVSLVDALPADKRGSSSESVDFLEWLRPGGPWVLTAIAPDGPSETTTARIADEVQKFVVKQDGRRNLYYAPNPLRRATTKKASKADVSAIEFVFGDLDPRKGESPDDAKRRYQKALASEPEASALVDSGNGLNALWRLEPRIDIPIGESSSAVIADAEARSKAIMERLGATAGTQNIDRILRLPGTTNLPNAAKRRAGRTECEARLIAASGAAYPIDAFPKDASREEAEVGGADASDISPDDARLANLGARWIALGHLGEGVESYKSRSEATFAFACECFRAGVDADTVASCLTHWKIGEHIRDQGDPDRALRRTITRARQSVEDSKLFEMNEQHAVLPIGGKTRVATWGQDPEFPGHKTIIRFSAFPDFKSLHDKYRYTYVGKDKKGDPKEVTVGLGTWWIDQPHRRQYDGGMRFMPTKNEDVVGDTLNLWDGFAVPARKPEGGSGAAGCKLLLDHGFKVICSGDEGHYHYLIHREAYIVQRRMRSEIAVALCTEVEGTGKGFWEKGINRLYGAHAMQVNRPEHVIGKHNKHLETLLRLTADEALFSGDPRHRDALYGLITEGSITIEPKFVDAYPAANYINTTIISNARHFIPASGTARRFFVPTVSPDRAKDYAYFKAIMTQLEDGGYGALLYHLLYEVDIRDFNVRDVPKTAGLVEQKIASLTTDESWWYDVLQRGELPGMEEGHRCSSTELHASYIQRTKDTSYSNRRSSETALGMFLSRAIGPDLRRTRTKGESGTTYVFPPLKFCREQFAARIQGNVEWDRPGAQWEAGY